MSHYNLLGGFANGRATFADYTSKYLDLKEKALVKILFTENINSE